MSEDLWREQAQGTLRRLAATPGTLWAFFGGKVLSIAAVFAVVASAALAVAHWLLGIPVSNAPAAVLWLAATGSALFLMLLLIQSFASGQRAGGVLVSAIVLPLAMLGGCFFPLETMPVGLAAIGRWTPNGWSVTRLDALLAGAAGPSTILWNFGLVAAVGALLFLALSARVRRRFPEYGECRIAEHKPKCYRKPGHGCEHKTQPGAECNYFMLERKADTKNK